MSFGEQLRKRREELGISRAELAGRLGISRSAVGNYETVVWLSPLFAQCT